MSTERNCMSEIKLTYDDHAEEKLKTEFEKVMEERVMNDLCLVVINGRVAREVTPDYPGAFYHFGAWYSYIWR